MAHRAGPARTGRYTSPVRIAAGGELLSVLLRRGRHRWVLLSERAPRDGYRSISFRPDGWSGRVRGRVRRRRDLAPTNTAASHLERRSGGRAGCRRSRWRRWRETQRMSATSAPRRYLGCVRPIALRSYWMSVTAWMSVGSLAHDTTATAGSLEGRGERVVGRLVERHRESATRDGGHGGVERVCAPRRMSLLV